MNKLNKVISKNKNGRKSASGITLIALVITIIVLLILAGITIAMLTGSDSAPAKANEAKQENDIGTAKDQLALLVQNAQLDAYDDIYVDNNNSVKSSVATNTVGQRVINAALNKYETAKQIGDATMQVTQSEEGQDAAVTITTRDKTVTGSISINGGVLTWGDNEQGGGSGSGTTLSIGDEIEYSTTLNGVTLDNWKVFYVEGDYTYLIYGDYLPSSAINSSNMSGIIVPDWSTYVVQADSLNDAITAFTTKTNWNSLLSGTINGKQVNESNNDNALAMGTPTIDLWLNSWNKQYPNDKLYAIYINDDDVDGTYFNSEGYAITDEEPSVETPVTSTEVNVSNKTGYSNKLYFPQITVTEDDNCEAYCISAPSAAGSGLIMTVDYTGHIGYDYIDDQSENSLRPVIKLPTSALNQ